MLTGNSSPRAGEFVEIVKEIARSKATTIASGRLLMADHLRHGQLTIQHSIVDSTHRDRTVDCETACPGRQELE